MVYSRTSARNKSWFFVRQFDLPLSAFATVDHTLHRQRRSAMNPFFSKQRIQQLEPSIQAQVDKLCARLEEFKGTGNVLRIREAYSCFAADVVMDYSTGSSLHYLESPDFMPMWTQTMQEGSNSAVLCRHFPLILTMMKSIPKWMGKKMNPGLALFYDFQEVSPYLLITLTYGQDQRY